MVHSIWQWLTDNGTALGVILALIPIAWAAIQYIIIKKAEDRRVRFTTFHNLIKLLVERENPNEPMRLDRQIAIIYELRDFKHYFPVTLRILKGLKSDWDSYGPPDKRKRLMEELDLAIEHIEKEV
jgi:hypothetical protein